MSRHITAQLAEAEPEAERLFSWPARPPSLRLRALFKRIEVWGHAIKSGNGVTTGPSRKDSTDGT